MSQAQAISRVRFTHMVLDPATGAPTRLEFAKPLYSIELLDSGTFAVTSITTLRTVYIRAEASWTVEPVDASSETTAVEKPKRKTK